MNSNLQGFFVERKIAILLALAVSLYLFFQRQTIFKNSHSYLIFIGTFIIQSIILLVGRHTNALNCRTSGLGFPPPPLQYFFKFINPRWDSLLLRRKYLSDTASPLLPAIYRNRHFGRSDSSQQSGMSVSLQEVPLSHHRGGGCLDVMPTF